VIRGLFGRLLAVMCGVAAASTGLAVLLQERSLSADLERAAERRLDAAAAAADRLLGSHLVAMAERYRAVSGTPQLRATLEVDDGPTLAHYAGTLLGQHRAVRIAFESAEGGLVAAAGDAELDAAALAVETAGLIAHAGRPYAVVSTELAGAGRLVAVEPISQETVDAWSELCGAGVAFSARAEPGGEGITRVVRRLGGLEMRVWSPLDAERAAMHHARVNLAVAAALGLFLAFGVSLVVSRSLVRPIHEVQGSARRIGAGDLVSQVATDRIDEIGDVARAFEDMRCELRGTLGRVAEAADRVDATAAAIAEGTQRFVAVTAEQQRGHDEAASALGEIRQRVRSTAKSAGASAHSLDLAIDGSSESFRELAHSGEELSLNAARLHEQTHDITASLEQVAESAAQVARDTEGLLPAAETTAASVADMAAAAQSVNDHAEETARLSGAVVEAAESGRRVVRQAVEGMDATLERAAESERVVRSLRERASEIGSILTVIDDVTGETGLLALNASIIAAQAGEHGRPFGVVAEQMKALSERVRASTEEIGLVVRAVQGDSADAAESIARGSVSAREGALLIQQAEAALNEIERAARESGERMAESARATAAQMRGASSVAESMQTLREGMRRIRAATQEQAEANIIVQRSSDALNRSAEAVQGTVEAQRGGTARIGESVEAAQRAVREITQGLEEQGVASRQVAEVVERSKEYTRALEGSASGMEAAARELEREAEALREAVRRFRV
jgi:methyl-accepting chemotaxis protein